MRLQHFSYVQRAALAGLLAAASILAAETPDRLHANIAGGQTFRLTGNVRPQIASATDLGEVSDSLALPRIAIHFRMTAAQKADLDALLEAQQNPSSPQFHKWLTTAQYAGRFGMSEADLARISAWLGSKGFTNIQSARSRTFVTMSGTAALVRSAFQTSIHSYRVKGEVHYANATNPALPGELQGMVSAVLGLNDFHPKPHIRPRPKFTSSITGNTYYAPGDFAIIYGMQSLYNGGINGTGQSIAVMGQTDIQTSDIEAFELASGLPIKDPKLVFPQGDPGPGSDGDIAESSLDLEWAGAAAPGATIYFVTSTDVIDVSTVYAIDNDTAPVIVLTYGECEVDFGTVEIETFDANFQQANAKGITVVVASGDQGAADCDDPTNEIAMGGLAVDYPASSAYVTGVGGTEFNEGSGNYWATTNNANAGSALSYIPEMAWNDTIAEQQLAASGGGVSSVFAKPSWQKAPGVPNDGFRDVPDLSLNASNNHDEYLFCEPFNSFDGLADCTSGYRDSSGNLDVIGGTSAGVPCFAGIVALINQQMGTSQGNVNPALYKLASVSADAFHDVTVGSNQVPCMIGSPNCTSGTLGYVAGPGYDQVTGLGSLNVANVLKEWASVITNPTAPPAPVLTLPANGATGVVAPLTLTWQASTGATSYNVYFGDVPAPPFVVATAGTSYAVGTLTAGATYYWSVTAVNAGGSASSATWSFTAAAPFVANPGPFTFVPVTPCRVADTRAAAGALGGPTMTGGSSRSFPIPQGACNIPATAQAYSLNVTVVPQGPLSYLTLWPTGENQPLASTLNAPSGNVVANAAIVPAGEGGAVSVFVTNNTDVVLDINGYFTSSGGAAFYAATPCRVVDTRNAAGPLGGPTMSPGTTRTLPVLSGACTIPAAATAYSMNVTVVPDGPLNYLTMWPAGEAQPVVSTLNSPAGNVLANAALVPAGTSGSISVYVTNQTDVVVDTNGYFAAPGSSGALQFYPISPCRVVDTRNADGPFGGPSMGAATARSFMIPAGSCSIPSTAKAYSLNVTVVPDGPLSYLTLWPAGATQPFVSTLNSYNGSVVANAAIVPAGTGGGVSVYVTNPTDVVLDINGYFAP
jgi:hypothetical protein